MALFNHDLLLKDELCYEALLRGLPHANVTVADVYKRQVSNISNVVMKLDNYDRIV